MKITFLIFCSNKLPITNRNWLYPWNVAINANRVMHKDTKYLNELRHQKNSALRLKLSLSNKSLPAAVAASGY